MTQIENLLTAARAEWQSNQLGLKHALTLAYAAVDKLVDTHEFLRTENLAMVKGQIRWVAVDYFLSMACVAGQITGIDVQWKKPSNNLKNSPVRVLELTGKHSRLSALHVMDADSTPRSSNFRNDQRLSNQMTFSFAEMEVADEIDSLVGLLLVHKLDGKACDTFATVRAYYDAVNPALHHSITGNILHLEGHAPVAAEEIEEALPALKKEVRKIAV